MHIFNRVKYQTPESVELEFTLAGIGNRAWALVIDYHILGLLIVGFLIVWVALATQIVELTAKLFGLEALELWLIAIALMVMYSIYTGYFVWFETLWQGQTPGKRFAKIRVIRDDGRPIGLQQATLRSLLRPFDDILFLGALLIICTPQEKRLGDWVAGTIAIQAESPATAATLTISAAAQTLATQILKSNNSFAQLLPDDFAVIREYLQRRSAMAPKARKQLSLQLAQQIQAILALESLPTATTPEVFLEAVYLAYTK